MAGSLRRGAIVAAVTCSLSCIIIPPDPPPVPVPVPVPVPTPADAQGIAVLWMFRVEPGTANLATAYQALVSDFDARLESEGLRVTTEAALSLYDARVLWAKDAAHPEPVSLSDALRYYAVIPPAATSDCSTNVLAVWGHDMTAIEVRWPKQLILGLPPPVPGQDGGIDDDTLDGGVVDAGVADGGGAPGLGGLDGTAVPDGFKPFQATPQALLVVLVDSGERPSAHESWKCAVSSMTPAQWFAPKDPVEWALFGGGPKMSGKQIRFATVATPEDGDDAKFRAHCLAIKTFPRTGLDVAKPSSVAFYGPFTSQMPSGSAHAFDFCEALGRTWEVEAFAREWVNSLIGSTPSGIK